MCARDLGRRTLLGLLLSAFSALPAVAQGVGAISGTITDNSDAIMPGVSVTLSSSQGTIGANQQTVTDPRGIYQFLRLVPGAYVVKAELQGFRPAEQQNILVNADGTSRADLKLQIGTLAEGVTVTGEAPLLDTTSALKQTVIPVEVLRTLPNRFDMWSAARISPVIVMSQVDVGGSSAFLQSGPTLRGSNSENGYFIDGMDVSNVEGNGSGTAFFLDPFAFQEMNLQMGAAGSASRDRGGLVFNMITRTGTNQFHGGAQYAGSGGRLNADNLSSELRTQLLASVPAVVLAANPNFQPASRIVDISDSGAWLSGPIVRDKLWFSFTSKYDVLNQYIVGSYNPNGGQVLEDNVKWTISEKVAWQMTKSAQLSYFNNLQYRRVGHRPITGTYSDSNSRALNYKYPDWHQLKFTSPWRSNMVFDASYSRLRYDDLWAPQREVALGTVSRYETTSDGYSDANPTYPDWDDYRDQVFASISVFTGRHDITAGYQFRLVGQKGKNISTSGMRANFTNNIPVSVNTYNVPIMADFSGPVQYRSLGQDQRALCAGQMETNQEAYRGLWPPFRDRFRLAAAIVLGDQRVRRGAVFLGNQRRSGFQDRRSAVFRRLRFERRRQDRSQIRREPLYQACRFGQWAASQPSRRCQRHAIVDGVRGGPDVWMRSQQRPDTTDERARALERLQLRGREPMGTRSEAGLFKRVLRRTAASASWQSRRLGRLHEQGST